MRDLALLVSIVGSMTVVGVAYLVLKDTLLDITYPRENPWGFLWYFSLIIVLVPLILVSYLGIDRIEVFYIAHAGLEFPVATITIVSLIVYILSLGLFLRLFGLCFQCRNSPPHYKFSYGKLERVCFSLSLLGLLLLGGFSLLGYRHAFVTSLIEGTPLLNIRLANKYSSQVPSQVAALVPLTGYLLAIFSGYIGRYRLAKSAACLAIALLILAAPGDKAPLVYGVLLWTFAQRALMPRRFLSLKFLGWLMFVLIVSLALIYPIYSLQVSQKSSFEEFGVYLVNRLGIGQMAGMYETFALAEQGHRFSSDFSWHLVPFAKFFVNYVDYQKYLMMVTEGYGFAEMGVKNSYFAAEAYAIGGWGLVALSPVIVGFTSSLGLYCLIRMFKSAVGSGLDIVAVPIYLMAHNITGGFSSFPLLKGLLMLVFHLGILWIWWKFSTVPFRVLWHRQQGTVRLRTLAG
jgi:hypothetical protein